MLRYVVMPPQRAAKQGAGHAIFARPPPPPLRLENPLGGVERSRPPVGTPFNAVSVQWHHFDVHTMGHGQISDDLLGVWETCLATLGPTGPHQAPESHDGNLVGVLSRLVTVPIQPLQATFRRVQHGSDFDNFM